MDLVQDDGIQAILYAGIAAEHEGKGNRSIGGCFYTC